jgi:flagellar motor switch protein FliN/FliY
MLLDLTLPVSIELGRTNMTVQEVLRLGRGSVVQLDRLAGEPIDIYVGDRRFAEGEVVVLGEHFGIRITRIISRQAVGENAA